MVYIQRELEKDLVRWFHDPEIILIRGPRQSGKTTLLERARALLIQQGVAERAIVSVTFENDIPRLSFEEKALDWVRSYLTDEKKQTKLRYP